MLILFTPTISVAIRNLNTKLFTVESFYIITITLLSMEILVPIELLLDWWIYFRKLYEKSSKRSLDCRKGPIIVSDRL